MGFFDDRDDASPPPDPFNLENRGQFRSPIGLRWIILGAAVLVFFVVLVNFKSIYVDWLWFDSIGPNQADSYLDVFQTIIGAKVLLFVIGTAISGVIIGVNIWLARRLAPEGAEESFIEEIDAQAIRRIVGVVLIAATLFLAVIFGSVAGGAWETVLLWQNGVSFGVDDPQFDRDISFFLFDLPFYHLVQGWVLALVVVSAAGAGAVYGLTLSLQRFELNITRGMRIHLSVLVGLALLVFTAGTWLGIFDLASAPGGIVAGATYTDVNARVPVRYILIALGAVAGVTVIVNAFLFSGYRAPILTLGLWVFAGVLGGAIYPAYVQRFQVDPNELDRETEFIARNIEMTRLAWDLEDIVELNFPAEPAVTLAEIEANPATIDNVRLLDTRPLRDTFNQLQSLRPFYFFNDVDVDRYTIDGVLTQVMVSARELDISRAQANWTRERLVLTHGYGAVVAPVNKVTAQGEPELLTKDIPPVGDEIPIATETAQIYFGEITNHYVIVKTNVDEFDYPVGETFATTRYEPDRGIKLSSYLTRFVLFWELGDTNLLISGQIDSSSRLLMKRSLSERIDAIAPFLTLDRDPYVVVDGERLIWIQDAYTTADNFPYSQSQAGINYIRNSVKITVDAITGDTTFYLIDEQEPVVATWAKIFPDLFTPLDDMPASIREHLRYPEDLFFRQAGIYLRYHITDPVVFFAGEDLWGIPTEKFRAQEQPVEPYYVIMTLPDEEQEEFTLILPFTPRGKQNTVAWFAGRSDGDALGELRAYRFPTDDLVLGPAQIEAKIDQDPGISQQLTLWDQSGSEVIRGNLLMIPIGDSFLYVEPIYLQAETSRFPELKRVVVATGTEDSFRIAMEPQFEDALDVLFGLRASTLPGAAAFVPPTSESGSEEEPAAQPPAEPTPAPDTGTTAPQPAGEPTDLLGQLQQTQQQLDALSALIEDLIRLQQQELAGE